MSKVNKGNPFIVNYESIAIPLGFYTSFVSESNSMITLAREISISLYGLDIDVGVLVPEGTALSAKALPHVYKTLNVDDQGNVGREAYGIGLFGKRGIVINHGYLSGPIRAVVTLNDAIKMTEEYISKQEEIKNKVHIINLRGDSEKRIISLHSLFPTLLDYPK